ncbi:MAG: hypothetical protein AB1Z98_27045 [Nannocystaceae bacterium]
MGKGDNRRTLKMLQRKRQRALKERLRRRAEQTKRERSGDSSAQS